MQVIYTPLPNLAPPLYDPPASRDYLGIDVAKRTLSQTRTRLNTPVPGLAPLLYDPLVSRDYLGFAVSKQMFSNISNTWLSAHQRLPAVSVGPKSSGHLTAQHIVCSTLQTISFTDSSSYCSSASVTNVLVPHEPAATGDYSALVQAMSDGAIPSPEGWGCACLSLDLLRKPLPTLPPRGGHTTVSAIRFPAHLAELLGPSGYPTGHLFRRPAGP